MDAGVVAATIPADGSLESKVHTDVMLFNRWSYDGVEVQLLFMLSISSSFARFVII